MIILYCFCTLILLILLLVGNTIQMLSIMIRPFSRRLFLKVNENIAMCWWSLCVFYLVRLKKLKLIYTGDDISPDENILLISNHQAMVDIIVVLCIGYRYKKLNRLKWFAKDMLKYIPGVGWGIWFLDCVFLKRKWALDQSSIEKTFNKIIKFKTPLWLISYVEGTRITPTKLKMSQAFAKENQLPIFNHVMLPRTKGFLAILDGLKGHLHSIVDITVGYKNRPPTLTEIFIKKIDHPIHLNMRKFPISTLPITSQERNNWLLNIFKEKDDKLALLARTGNFSEDKL